MYLQGSETLQNSIFRTQVYKATHDAGDNRLPFMYRSFISFTYGGKIIEDFGLIAITESNSIDRKLSADFKDYTISSKKELLNKKEMIKISIYTNSLYSMKKIVL